MITTRRQLLIGGLRVTVALPAMSSVAGALATRNETGDERSLVVLQLTGGNDGLNTVVPHRQDAYFRQRPTLALARGGLHRLDDDHGLHPAMAGLGALYDEGKVGVVHGIGYPHPDRSHFRSMEIWHTAEPEAPAGELGWLGRLADQIVTARPGSMAALHVGATNLPLALYGRETFTPTVRDARGFRLEDPGGRFGALRARLIERDAQGELGFLRDAARSTYRAARKMEELADRPGRGEYPNTELGRRLRLIASLVAGGFGTRLFHVALTGFDTHSQQARAHAGLLGTLSSALTAFQRDLESAGVAGRVMTLVFSEFGRRVRENGSKGTDHGAGAPAFVVGAKVKGGMHGEAPSLAHLDQGDVPFTTDFRSVYSALERHWMGLVPSSRIPPLRVV